MGKKADVMLGVYIFGGEGNLQVSSHHDIIYGTLTIKILHMVLITSSQKGYCKVGESAQKLKHLLLFSLQKMASGKKYDNIRIRGGEGESR